jgi:hypothetical protein
MFAQIDIPRRPHGHDGRPDRPSTAPGDLPAMGRRQQSPNVRHGLADVIAIPGIPPRPQSSAARRRAENGEPGPMAAQSAAPEGALQGDGGGQAVNGAAKAAQKASPAVLNICARMALDGRA